MDAVIDSSTLILPTWLVKAVSNHSTIIPLPVNSLVIGRWFGSSGSKKKFVQGLWAREASLSPTSIPWNTEAKGTNYHKQPYCDHRRNELSIANTKKKPIKNLCSWWHHWATDHIEPRILPISGPPLWQKIYLLLTSFSIWFLLTAAWSKNSNQSVTGQASAINKGNYYITESLQKASLQKRNFL